MTVGTSIPADAPRRLAEACGQLQLDVTPQQVETLLGYAGQLQRWNRTYNLTAIRDPGQILVQHIHDSLSVVGPLSAALADRPAPRLYDVGSGGGLPGAVIAILRQGWQVTCIDAVEKKATFVRQMSGVLHLGNLRGVHARVESLPPGECDVVISRAFASLSDFAELAGRHVGPDGTLVAMKGKLPEEEIDALHAQDTWQVQRVETLAVPELQAQRCLIWMRRR
ncbi:16S rRNA (guanine(527)-N(7))-methyltransferase RsmG [Bordetella sp. 2513F-2]